MRNTLANVEIESIIFQKTTNTLTQAKELREAQNTARADGVPELRLRDYNKVAMTAGSYKFEAEQKVIIGGEYDAEKKKVVGGKNADTFQKNCVAVVETPLTPFNQSDIYRFYPPKSAFGSYADVLPHVVLRSKDLPWQCLHKDAGSKTNTSWLALVLLTEEEADLTHIPGKKIKVPQHLIPSADVLRRLVHVAQTPDGTERAVLIAHRLPKPGSSHVAHVIALHEENKDNTYTSLFSWNFTCDEEDNSFSGLMTRLDCDLLRLPAPAQESASEESADPNKLKAVIKCLEHGFVPLPHFARNGQRIMSWYRGPLTPYDVDAVFRIRYINHSDHLLRWFKKSKRLDTTYAAAWELGRWLTLQRKETAEKLYTWKRGIALSEKLRIRSEQQEKRKVGKIMARTEETLAKLFAGATAENIFNMPDSVRSWLIDLVTLAPVPFCNLIPDERMLPEESLRMFHVDEGWIWALIDGALSIGRMPTAKENKPISIPELYLTGCIFRSEAIDIFPDFSITANGKLLPVQRRKIGRDIMLCLFYCKKPIKSIEVFLQSGETHFGLDPAPTAADDDPDAPRLGKHFFKLPDENLKNPYADVPFSDKAERIIDVNAFAEKMGEKGKSKSGLFAMRLLETVPKVVFKSR